jgi:hypothetical protein
MPMSAIRITRRQLGALARYHELLTTCRRLGNIARARSRVLREEWSACGLEPARRSRLLSPHVFHGVVLTPRAIEAVDRGLPPTDSALVAHAGVLLASTESPDFELRNPQMPELQVGLWLEAAAGAIERHRGLIETLERDLGAAGYTILAHHAEVDPADPDDHDTRWMAYAMVRRLSLASLLDEDDPAAAASRFYTSALKPLAALEDEQIGMLLQLTGHDDVCERELPR